MDLHAKRSTPFPPPPPPAPHGFDMLQYFEEIFYLQWKVVDLLYKLRYILWVVALLGACDVTNLVTVLTDFTPNQKSGKNGENW